MRGRPGSAPPIRTVTDAEIAKHLPLVHHTLKRMIGKGQIVPDVEYEDLAAVGAWAVWEALRRWEPDRGAVSSYLSAYIWGYVMKHQRDVTRALGWNRSQGDRVASVVSYEQTLMDDITIADTLAAPDDTAATAVAAVTVARMRDRVDRMRPTHRASGLALLDDRPMAETAAECGVSRQGAANARPLVLADLARLAA